MIFSYFSALVVSWLIVRLATNRPLGERSEPCLAAKRPTASDEVVPRRRTFLKVLLIVLDGYSLYWRNFAIPPHGYHPHVLPLLGLHDEPLHHHQGLNRPNSRPQGEGWGRLILASENPGNKNSNQSLLTLNKQITANDNFIFATLRLHGSRWLSKCIVGLFWGSNFCHVENSSPKTVPQCTWQPSWPSLSQNLKVANIHAPLQPLFLLLNFFNP